MTTPEYRQPTHREELERELVHGAATHIASEPHHAGAIAEAIKTVLDTLYPIAATPTSAPAGCRVNTLRNSNAQVQKEARDR